MRKFLHLGGQLGLVYKNEICIKKIKYDYEYILKESLGLGQVALPAKRF